LALHQQLVDPCLHLNELINWGRDFTSLCAKW
jgi:hypothetical protein